MATYTASLTLSDSGNTYSSSTSSPLKINAETYTKAFAKVADILTGTDVTYTIPFEAEFVMVRALDGVVFVTLFDSGNTPADLTESSFKLYGVDGDLGARGWFMYSCTASPTTTRAIDSIYVQNSSGTTATYQIIAYA
jgi:hypothetical protein